METVAYSNKTASGVVSAVPGAFYGCYLTGGSDAATLIVYDNASAASGTIVCKLAAAAGVTVSFTPGARLVMANGLYAALTGTAPSATVLFTP